jgi:hypothetical protein
MQLWLVLILIGVVFPGCALIRIGPAAEIEDVSEADDAEKNIDAIRALQADRYRRAPVPTNAASQSKVPSSDASIAASAAVSSHAAGNQVQNVLPSPSRVQQNFSNPATGPQLSLTPPSPTIPDRSVPAYTIPAPVPPNQAGTSRCVPDGLGGQRCLAH